MQTPQTRQTTQTTRTVTAQMSRHRSSDGRPHALLAMMMPFRLLTAGLATCAVSATTTHGPGNAWSRQRVLSYVYSHADRAARLLVSCDALPGL